MTRKRQNLHKANTWKVTTTTTPWESQSMVGGSRAGGWRCRGRSGRGGQGWTAASPQRPGAAGPQSREEVLAAPRRAGDQGVGERHLRKVVEAAGWGFSEPSEQTLPRPAPLGRFRRGRSWQSASPPRPLHLGLCQPSLRPRSACFLCVHCPAPGPYPALVETLRKTVHFPALLQETPDAEATSLHGTAAEARPPSARGGEPQSGPPAAAGRTRRLRGQVTGRVPARPSLSAAWDLTRVEGETRVTWRNGHVRRRRGAESELARSRDIRGGHVTARERCGLT